jgi:hypothetical protein
MTTPDGHQFGIAPPTQSHGRWLRILVALSIILAFAGILLATHYYVSRQRAQDTIVTGNTTSPFVGREGFVMRTANLRREPSQSSNPPLRTVERGSRVRILSVSDNNSWYEVEVLTLEGGEHDSITRGWMGKSTISFD